MDKSPARATKRRLPVARLSPGGPPSLLMEVYRRLYTRYGPQRWWPGDGPFEVMVGAILTQAAAWTNVEKAIAHLKVAGALSPEALRRVSVEELARLIYPAGYHNVKARKLKAFAHYLGEGYRDSLEAMFSRDPETLREELLSIYGIGQETADSMLLYAAHKPVFVIDAYTQRILRRLGFRVPGKSYGAYQSFMVRNLSARVSLYNEYHALLVKLGKDLCRKIPRCRGCCLLALCAAGKRTVGASSSRATTPS